MFIGFATVSGHRNGFDFYCHNLLSFNCFCKGYLFLPIIAGNRTFLVYLLIRSRSSSICILRFTFSAARSRK